MYEINTIIKYYLNMIKENSHNKENTDIKEVNKITIKYNLSDYDGFRLHVYDLYGIIINEKIDIKLCFQNLFEFNSGSDVFIIPEMHKNGIPADKLKFIDNIRCTNIKFGRIDNTNIVYNFNKDEIKNKFEKMLKNFHETCEFLHNNLNEILKDLDTTKHFEDFINAIEADDKDIKEIKSLSLYRNIYFNENIKKSKEEFIECLKIFIQYNINENKEFLNYVDIIIKKFGYGVLGLISNYENIFIQMKTAKGRKKKVITIPTTNLIDCFPYGIVRIPNLGSVRAHRIEIYKNEKNKWHFLFNTDLKEDVYNIINLDFYRCKNKLFKRKFK